jgi:hypothetical protein
MGGFTPTTPGRIFISYRRQETAYPAGWLYDRVAGYFGRDQVFKDVDSIVLGDDFAEVIANAVGSCDALLALIGDRWLTITGHTSVSFTLDRYGHLYPEADTALRDPLDALYVAGAQAEPGVVIELRADASRPQRGPGTR